MGGVPRNLESTIQTGIDITQLLLLNRDAAAALGVAIGAGTNVVFTVPPGELWYVHAYSGGLTCGAGDTLTRVYPLFQPNSSGRTHAFEQPQDCPANNSIRTLTLTDTWLPPGSTLGVWVGAFTGAPTGNFGVTYTKLRI